MRVSSCTNVSHHVSVTALRPHTKQYDQVARDALGLAVTRAREAAGYSRPAFAKVSGVGKTSLYKIESGIPVSASVYEAVARALPRWTEDTPRIILEGGPIPPTETKEPNAAPREEEAPAQELDPDLADFLRPVIRTLRNQGVSREAINRAIARVAKQIERGELGELETERDDPDTPRGQVS